jgi:type IV pilus assembly protein PilM
MERMTQLKTRPRLACEVAVGSVIAARAADKAGRVDLFTSRRLRQGAIAPGLSTPNVHDGETLRTAISGALEAVTNKSRDVIVVLPDSSIRVLLLDFETLPAKSAEAEPVIRFRLKKSLPFDVEHAAISYDVHRDSGVVHVVAAVSPRSVIDEYEAAFRDVGYNPGVVVSSSLAALGLIEGQVPTLLLKVDPVNITIAAAQNQELRLIRTLENPHGAQVSASELAEAVLPSVVFFEDTFGTRIEKIFVSGVGAMDEVGPLLHHHTGAEVLELEPDLSSDQNLSGDDVDSGATAGVVGALLG